MHDALGNQGPNCMGLYREKTISWIGWDSYFDKCKELSLRSENAEITIDDKSEIWLRELF